MNHVFVYGTLKEGFSNFKFNRGTRLKGTFITKNRYPLYLVGKRYSPWLVFDEGRGVNIKGQVFFVDEPALNDMDKLERISEPDGYRRLELTVVSEESGEELTVFVYGKPIEHMSAAQLKSGTIDEYTIAHSLLYQSRNL